jgi:hypothetical protein
MSEEEDDRSKYACRFCEYYGYDECPIGGCELEDGELEEE